MVDAFVSGASAERCAGSSPVPGTRKGLQLKTFLRYEMCL